MNRSPRVWHGVPCVAAGPFLPSGWVTVALPADLLKGRAEDLKPDPFLRKSPSLESLGRPPPLGFGGSRLLSASPGGWKPQSKLRYPRARARNRSSAGGLSASFLTRGGLDSTAGAWTVGPAPPGNSRPEKRSPGAGNLGERRRPQLHARSGSARGCGLMGPDLRERLAVTGWQAGGQPQRASRWAPSAGAGGLFSCGDSGNHSAGGVSLSILSSGYNNQRHKSRVRGRFGIRV